MDLCYVVEAEPGAEYFIAIQKLEKTETNVRLNYAVDGKKINAALNYSKTEIDKKPRFKGIRSEINGVSTHDSLVFVKPRISESSVETCNLCMGKVEVKLREFTYTGQMRMRGSGRSESKFAAASVALNQAGVAKKKNLRSEKGTTTITKVHHYRRDVVVGNHLDTSKFSSVRIG